MKKIILLSILLNVTVSPIFSQKLEQTYQLQPGFDLEVFIEGEKLMTQATGQNKIEIFPESQDTFFAKVVDAKLKFVKNEEGKYDKLILYQAGREMEAKRK